MRIHNGSPATSLGEVVLFPLDDHSLPLSDGPRLLPSTAGETTHHLRFP